VREVCEGNDSRQRLLFSFAPLTLVQLATVHGMVCCEIPLLRVWWKSQIDHKRQAEPFGFGSKHGRNRPSSSNRSCCLPTERTRDMSWYLHNTILYWWTYDQNSSSLSSTKDFNDWKTQRSFEVRGEWTEPTKLQTAKTLSCMDWDRSGLEMGCFCSQDLKTLKIKNLKETLQVWIVTTAVELFFLLNRKDSDLRVVLYFHGGAFVLCRARTERMVVGNLATWFDWRVGGEVLLVFPRFETATLVINGKAGQNDPKWESA
jgi:hypothetical protein